MWRVKARKGKTELREGIPGDRGQKASAMRIATYLRNFGWSDVKVYFKNEQ